MNRITTFPVRDRSVRDPETPAVHEQMIVFARELGERCRLERTRSAELERVLGSLQESYLATMKALAQVVEAKDRTTLGHLDRTQAYGLALASRIDGALVQTPTLGYAFFLHDIGKVGVPERILCKRGPLTLGEWKVMRRHPLMGAEIVAPIAFLRDTVGLIRHHHERFDGTGYPDGLRDGRIPLTARIFAVADAFDAMTSDRPYREAVGIDRALAEIEAGAGSQFEPEVVRVFVQMIDEGGFVDGHEQASAIGPVGSSLAWSSLAAPDPIGSGLVGSGLAG
jgi:HD-GYP domain-containing protein (c-di-GMP phosphodiesterase class II)